MLSAQKDILDQIDQAVAVTGEEGEIPQRSTLVSRNITVRGRRTSVRLEPEMWTALKDIARRERCRIHDLCSLIDLRKNPRTSLTAAIRVFLMLYYRAASTEEGHLRARHGDFNNMLYRTRASRLDVSLSRPRRAAISPVASPVATPTPASVTILLRADERHQSQPAPRV